MASSMQGDGGATKYHGGRQGIQPADEWKGGVFKGEASGQW